MIRPSMRKLFPIVLAALPLGCDGAGTPSVSSSTQEVTVKGNVTIKGKPVPGAEVVFDPTNVNRRNASSSRGKVNPDGTYTATALVGENIVTIQGAPISKAGLIMNRKEVTLKSGENTVDIEVTKWGMPGS